LEDWIVDFLNRLTDLRNQHDRAIVPGDANVRATQISNSALQRSNGVEDENAHFAISIFKDMEPMLVKRMKQLFRRYMDSSSNEDARTEFEFLLAAGSYQKLRNPILQLIKTLSAIFGLPQELSLEARVLRRQLLKIVDVREFSDEGVFKNPSTSLKVCQLVCKHCSYVCDMDLCRNDFLVKMVDSQYTFVCENCNQHYDRVELEERLVQELQRLMTLFQVQDLKCEKCKRIRESDLTDHCECSGAWMETLPRCEVSKKVQIYKDVSNFYDMELLQSVVVDVEQY
jgi:DNA polymerase epsilon subunit 1